MALTTAPQYYAITGRRPNVKNVLPSYYPYEAIAQKKEEEFRKQQLAQEQKALDIEESKIPFQKELFELEWGQEGYRQKLESERAALEKDLAQKRADIDIRLAGESQELEKKRQEASNLYSTIGLGVTGLTVAKQLWPESFSSGTQGLGAGLGAVGGYYAGKQIAPKKSWAPLLGAVIGGIAGYYTGGGFSWT